MFYHDGKSIPDAPPKDPDSVVDYGCDWSGLLQSGETVASSTWSIPVDLSGSDETNTGTITGVMLSGGVEGSAYTVTNQVVTSLGRTHDRSMIIRCQNK